MKRVAILCFILVGLLPFVNSAAVGISPAYHKFFFEPGLEKELTFYVSSSDPGQIIEIYVLGDLSEYVEVSHQNFTGSGNLVVNLNLPNSIETPGTHRILIGALQGANINDETAGQGVGGRVAVQAPIDIIVPYPGRYAEGTFSVQDVNVGENSAVKFEINNLGTEKVTVSPEVRLIDSSGNIVLTESYGPKTLDSEIRWNYQDHLNTSGFGPGVYSASFVFDYGRVVRLEDELRIGQLLVNVTNYSYLFDEGEISRFDVEIENLWNLPLDDVYASVGVTLNGTPVDQFNTPSVSLNPWEKKTLTGFFDAKDLSPGRYLASINVYYANESTNKLVAIYINETQIDMKLVILGISAGIFVVLSLSVIIYLLVRIRKLRRMGGRKIEKKKK